MPIQNGQTVIETLLLSQYSNSMPLNPFRGESIAEAAQQAIESLAALSDNFEGSEKDRDRKGATSKCEDESARLKQWVGQHDVRSGALDHRLREASHLRERVHGLLKDLSSRSYHAASLHRNATYMSLQRLRLVVMRPLYSFQHRTATTRARNETTNQASN